MVPTIGQPWNLFLGSGEGRKPKSKGDGLPKGSM